jgi:hypothetical protein
VGKIMRMFVFLALLLAAPVYGQDEAADLRGAAGCGPAKTQFDVKTDKKQHTLTQPESGKALIYIFEQFIPDPRYLTLGHVTTRVGLDGNWVGANHESSYMFFSVEPGAHRLCSDMQSILVSEKVSAATELMVESGKTYYYRVVVKDEHNAITHFSLNAVDGAEGRLLISNSALSSAQKKK